MEALSLGKHNPNRWASFAGQSPTIIGIVFRRKTIPNKTCLPL
jgi:hypothetical protein